MSRRRPFGPITLDVKCAGTRSAGNPPATCDVAGAETGLWTHVPVTSKNSNWRRRRREMNPCGSDLLLEKRIVAEIDHHRVQTPLEPAIEGIQVTPIRPRRRHTVPAAELLLENQAAHLFHIRPGFFLVRTFRKQIDGWLSPEIFQPQLVTRWIHPMQPI